MTLLDVPSFGHKTVPKKHFKTGQFDHGFSYSKRLVNLHSIVFYKFHIVNPLQSKGTIQVGRGHPVTFSNRSPGAPHVPVRERRIGSNTSQSRGTTCGKWRCLVEVNQRTCPEQVSKISNRKWVLIVLLIFFKWVLTRFWDHIFGSFCLLTCGLKWTT